MKTRAILYWAALISAATCITPGYATDLTVSNPVATPAGSPASASAAPTLPYGASEVVKMYQGGIGKDVLVSYIDGSIASFHLTADSIIYLQHLGLPQEVTAAMLRRDGELQRQSVAAYQQPTTQAPPVAAYQSPVAMPNAPAPQVDPYPQQQLVAAPQVVVQDYGTPYYPYAYDPVIIGGIGWGYGYPYWGHGWYGHGWGGPGFHGGFHSGIGFGGGFHGGGFSGGFHSGGGGGSHGGGHR